MVMRTCNIYLANFKCTILTIITILYIRYPEIICLITESLHPLINMKNVLLLSSWIYSCCFFFKHQILRWTQNFHTLQRNSIQYFINSISFQTFRDYRTKDPTFYHLACLMLNTLWSSTCPLPAGKWILSPTSAALGGTVAPS